MSDSFRAAPSTEPPDITSCERELIHLPGAIEPNGAMLVAGAGTLTILQASSNVERFLMAAPDALLGTRLPDLFPEEFAHQLSGVKGDGQRHYIAGLTAKCGVRLDALVHGYQGLLILELEPASPAMGSGPMGSGPEIFGSLTVAADELGGRLPLADLCQRMAARIRGITGFDRVMVYRFQADDTGCVVAEDKRQDIAPYLGLRYPASDIPAQARRLYLLNTLRLIADVNAPVAALQPSINPFTGAPLDMTYCILRAMSPVHIEYLRNMGVAASMSISIVKDGKLWGLIACHHGEAKTVAQPVRITCEVLARIFSSHIAMAEERDAGANVAAIFALTGRIEERMRRDREVVAALSAVDDGRDIASVIGADGCVFVIREEIVLLGNTPTQVQVEALSAWLNLHQREHLFSTEQLSAVYPEASEFETVASGLLSVRVALGSPDYVLWFRRPVNQVITWAGDPEKPVEATGAGERERISPRRSFAEWQQTFHDRSEKWTPIDRSFAAALRPVIAETLFILMNEEVLRLNLELARSNDALASFAYSASHDLQEPVRTIGVYAHLLLERSGPEMEPKARGFLAEIEVAASRMASLISALLSYSQLGGVERRRNKLVNLESVLERVLATLNAQIRQTGAEITHDRLPVVFNNGDHMVQLLQNLIGNAIKYRGEQPPRIHLSALLKQHEWLLCVSDNGQGFDAAQADFIFQPFKRLHGPEVAGNGIGLATCKRIVEIGKGRIWAESDGKDRGARFWLTLPALKDQLKPVGL